MKEMPSKLSLHPSSFRLHPYLRKVPHRSGRKPAGAGRVAENFARFNPPFDPARVLHPKRGDGDAPGALAEATNEKRRKVDQDHERHSEEDRSERDTTPAARPP